MAKKQTFGDKVKKGSAQDNLKYIKVFSVKRSKTNNALKFSEQMIAVSGDKNIDSEVKEFFNR